MANTKAKRIVICFDGTWNGRRGVWPTNIEKLAASVASSGPDGTQQLVLYLPGVGSSYKVDQFLGGAFGLGLMQGLKTGYKFLVANYNDGDDIILFGFSRGAFAARSLASMLHFPGLVNRGHTSRAIDHAANLYVAHSQAQAGGRDPMSGKVRGWFSRSSARRQRVGDEIQSFQFLFAERKPEVAFLGVFDTVGALGRDGIRAPGGSSHDMQLSPAVRTARQALAIDEHRLTFAPEIWSIPVGANSDDDPNRVKQVWFEGAHSDIGGGTGSDGDPINSLADTTLLWMLLEAHDRAGLEVDYPVLERELHDENKIQLADHLSNFVHPSLKWWFRPFDLPRLARQAVGKDPAFSGRNRNLIPDASAWNVKVSSSALSRYRGDPMPGLDMRRVRPYRPANLVALIEAGDMELAAVEEKVVWVPFDSPEPNGLRKMLPESFTHCRAHEEEAVSERLASIPGYEEYHAMLAKREEWEKNHPNQEAEYQELLKKLDDSKGAWQEWLDNHPDDKAAWQERQKKFDAKQREWEKDRLAAEALLQEGWDRLDAQAAPRKEARGSTEPTGDSLG